MAQVGANGKLHMIGNFRFTGKRLGKGNFAKVEEALHIHLNMKVGSSNFFYSDVIEMYLMYLTAEKINKTNEIRLWVGVANPRAPLLYKTFHFRPLSPSVKVD